ncbi:MAG: DNA-binding response regulator [Alistipes sp.]|nr:DNA-binding response regulator [Alistipes sp.]MDE6858564.1 DNA-binding response regulator [Alistipes sp.]
MKRIALISSDSALRRTVALALECAGAEITTDTRMEELRTCDIVVVIGAAAFASGRLSVESLRRCGEHRPEIFVISWQHTEQTVLSMLECGVDQYMTFPVCLGRLRIKAADK